jgi:hypothetical protein
MTTACRAERVAGVFFPAGGSAPQPAGFRTDGPAEFQVPCVALSLPWSPMGRRFKDHACPFLTTSGHMKKNRWRHRPQAGHCVTWTSANRPVSRLLS